MHRARWRKASIEGRVRRKIETIVKGYSRMSKNLTILKL